MIRFYCAAIYLDKWCIPIVMSPYDAPENFVEDIVNSMTNLHVRYVFNLSFVLWSKDAERAADVSVRPPKETERYSCSMRNNFLLRECLLKRVRRLFT